VNTGGTVMMLVWKFLQPLQKINPNDFSRYNPGTVLDPALNQTCRGNVFFR
jgi:hypothetical protein